MSIKRIPSVIQRWMRDGSVLSVVGLNTALAILFVWGAVYNFAINQDYSSATSGTIGEWLISYSGGFTRRGLTGSLIYQASRFYGWSPVQLIWAACLLSLVALIAIFRNFCRGKLSFTLLFSAVFLMGPIIGNYLIRKDLMILSLYGLCLIIIQQSSKFKRRTVRIVSIVLINLISCFAVLSHEAYGFWGIPSLIAALAIGYSSSDKLKCSTLSKAGLALSPAIAAFMLCLLYKGSWDGAVQIHQSWQRMNSYFPPSALLNSPGPQGAIEALSWPLEKGLAMSLSNVLRSDFILWIPAAWLGIVYLSMSLFLRSGVKESPQSMEAKRLIVLWQFLTITPLFFFAIDYGRWIFMWMTSSAFFYGYIDSDPILRSRFIRSSEAVPGAQQASRILPGIPLAGWKSFFILLLAVPCYDMSIKWYLACTPLNYFRFLIKTIL